MPVTIEPTRGNFPRIVVPPGYKALPILDPVKVGAAVEELEINVPVVIQPLVRMLSASPYAGALMDTSTDSVYFIEVYVDQPSAAVSRTLWHELGHAKEFQELYRQGQSFGTVLAGRVSRAMPLIKRATIGDVKAYEQYRALPWERYADEVADAHVGVDLVKTLPELYTVLTGSNGSKESVQ